MNIIFGSWFQSIAPLYLKLPFRNSLFGLGSVRSVALFLRWKSVWSAFLLTKEFLDYTRCRHLVFYTSNVDLARSRLASSASQERDTPQRTPTKNKEWHGFISENGENIYKYYKLKNMFSHLTTNIPELLFTVLRRVLKLDKHPRNPGGDSVKQRLNGS